MIPREHEFEPVPGLPEMLPAGERIVWQGAPDWRAIAVEALHVRKIALYFAILALWGAVDALADGRAFTAALISATLPIALGIAASGIVCLLAWLVGRTALYTLTNRRVVLRIGVVLGVTFNLPFRAIDGVSLRALSDGRGDISLVLGGDDRISYLHLWPHARPWRVARPEPTLRGVPDAVHVARLLADAVATSSSTAATTVISDPASTDADASPVSGVVPTAGAGAFSASLPAGIAASSSPNAAEPCHA